jgi:hypothetical protein
MNAPFRDLLASLGKCTIALTFYFRLEIIDETILRSLIDVFSQHSFNSEL